MVMNEEEVREECVKLAELSGKLLREKEELEEIAHDQSREIFEYKTIIAGAQNKEELLLDYIDNKHVGVRDKDAVLNIDQNEMINVTFNGKDLQAPVGELINTISTFDNPEDARAYIDAFEGLSETHKNYFDRTYNNVHNPDEPISKNIFKGIENLISETVGSQSTIQRNADIELLTKYSNGVKIYNTARLNIVLEKYNLDKNKNTVKQFLENQ